MTSGSQHLVQIRRGSERNRKARQKIEADRHNNIKNTNKTEHDIYTFKTIKTIYENCGPHQKTYILVHLKLKTQIMNNVYPTKKPGSTQVVQ